MVKLLGSGLIAAGFAAVWARQTQADRQELALLEDLIRTLELLADRIRLSRAPLPRLLGELARRPGPAAALPAAVCRELEGGAPLYGAWTGAVSALPLGEDARCPLAELAYRLSGDEQSVCRGLELAGTQLQSLLALRQRRQRDRARQRAALCFSGAAMLIILLL